MTQARLISRLMHAAEQWGRRQYRQDVVAVSHGDTVCCADGTIQAVVELGAHEARDRPQQVRCLATLELDGTISCVTAGAMSDSHGTRQ